MQDKRPTFHRANIESILFSPCKHRIHPPLTARIHPLSLNISNHTSQKTLATPLRPYRKAIPLNVILSEAKVALPLFKILRVSFYCIFHKAIQLNVILSEAKNLVVATTRGCLIYPHKKRLAQCIASTARTTTPLVILSVYCLMHSAIYTVRTVGLLVILSVAKNLVVAPARVCLIIPHKKCLAHHNTYSARFCLIWRKTNLGCFANREVIMILVTYPMKYKNDFGCICNEV